MKIGHSKNQLQSFIWTYCQRRENLKLKFGVRSSEYRKRIKPIDRKLGTWRRAIRRMEEREREIKYLCDLVEGFFEVKIVGNILNKKTYKAKGIFYRYGMENGINGRYLSEYIGAKGAWVASRNRLRFIRNKDNRVLWQQFKNYVNDVIEDKALCVA